MRRDLSGAKKSPAVRFQLVSPITKGLRTAGLSMILTDPSLLSTDPGDVFGIFFILFFYTDFSFEGGLVRPL